MNDSIEIIRVTSSMEVKDFIKLPYTIYKNDPYWIPPLESEIKSLLEPTSNALLRKGPFQFILAKQNGQTVGRLGMGVDHVINQSKNRQEGWITLFEVISDYQVAKTMLDYAASWLKAQGMNTIVGPISPTRGDDYRGLMIMGFGSPPVLMGTYNPVYYLEFFEQYGFIKNMDFCAYYYDLKREIDPKLLQSVARAKERYGYEVHPLRMERINEELLDVKQILEEAIPADWPHLVPPDMEELNTIADQLLKIAEPSLINIARHGDRPIGFAIALPDYNNVLRHLNGRLLPIGFLKFLWYKKKIHGGRIFVNFVVPDFHRKGVSAAVYLKAFLAAKKLGYTYAEGSYIGEWNEPMRRDAEGAGGILYKMFRIYEREI